MTQTQETALRPDASREERDAARTTEWQGMYHAMLAQLMANVETMVAHAFAAHAADHNLPIPSAVASRLSQPTRAPAADEREADTPTRNPGLDALNAQLEREAPTLVAPSATPTPPWLHPFTLPEKVRFTRTPDPIMRWERSLPTQDELIAQAAEVARAAAAEAARIAQEEHARGRRELTQDSSTPIWRKPFTLPPNVRYTRTPDPKLPKDQAVGESAPGAEASEAMTTPTRVGGVSLRSEEGVSSVEDSAESGFRAVTVTKTVTTVESVTVSTIEAGASGAREGAAEAEVRSGDMIVSEAPAAAAALLTDMASREHPSAETHEDEQPPMTGLLSRAEEATVAQHGMTAEPSADVSLPAWLTIIRAQAQVVPGTATEQDNQTVQPSSLWTDSDEADAEGSAALWRYRFLAEFDDDAGTAPPHSIASPLDRVDTNAADEDVTDAVWESDDYADKSEMTNRHSLEDEVEATAGQGSFRAAPERRAFGSHGIPAFEQAVHFDSDPDTYEHPPIELLVVPQKPTGQTMTREALEQNARLLEGVLEDFGIRGEIIAVRPGPVVTLYELEPAPGVKSSRVMGLSDDIARSMSAISARVAVVQGRNVIGIELPNERRETVFLRELIGSDDFGGSGHKLAIALGKTIGGESVIVDLARMPHLLVAGTTGSGKSVAINTMILSLLYRTKPEECRLIMVDPKMLELSIYDGIPHLLTPVVTDSKKAVIALKWAVREMEDRYKKMSKVGVRNIDGFNARVAEAQAKGEVITRTVQMGFDRETGEAVFETEAMDLSRLPYIVIIVDEMADLMMVAGKEIEGAIQRLAQMARAAGIHLIMATQRPSVDVITGTIKANFPTRISFQVTSKIDSRTILGEQGAEQLLGQGDMLHMAGGGRIVRVHGPFVSDGEVEKVVWHLKSQGHPEYLDVVTADEEEPDPDEDVSADGGAVFDKGNFGDDSADLYDQAVKVVLRDKKCSTSYIQRRLQVGYNKAASLVERMEKEGLVGAANHAGKREILNYSRDHQRMIVMPGED